MDALRKFGETWEARVALGYRLEQLVRFTYEPILKYNKKNLQ